jgi:trk system potassium uptake protein
MLRMKIIIAGAGKVGVRIAKQLIEENKDVVLIDRDLERVRAAGNTLDCMVIHGEANNRNDLIDAGIKDADFFVSVTESDELNMIACGIVSNEFSVPNKIARVRNFDYSDSLISGSPFLGIDYIVNPEIEAARSILRSVEHGATSDIMYFEDSSYEMRTMVITESSLFEGKTVKEIKSELQLDFIIAVALRENDYIITSGSTEIHKGDTLYLIGTKDTLDTIFSSAGKERTEIKHIVIVGGGRIGTYVAKGLIGSNPAGNKNVLSKLFKPLFSSRQKYKLVIIENDYEICKSLSELLPDALVINSDVSDEGILEDGEYSSYDLLIAATENQELNLITSQYAKSLGIKRTVALVQKNHYLRIAMKMDIDAAISLNNSMVNTVLKYVRQGNIKNVHAISGGELEIIEVSCDQDCTFVGHKIKDIKLPPDSLFVFISHEDKNLLPYGEYLITLGDHVILITTKKSIKKLDKLLAQPL